MSRSCAISSWWPPPPPPPRAPPAPPRGARAGPPQPPEEARMLPRENEQLLHEAGLFRFHQPKRFGGMALGFEAIVDIVAELARGCPSTAWCVSNYAYHHWLVAYYDEQTQHEVWDANPDALIASSIALAAGRGREGEGGFVGNGRRPLSPGGGKPGGGPAPGPTPG